MENINVEFLMIVPALNFVGYILKHSFPQLPNRYIPLVLLGLGIIATCSIGGITLINVIQGVLVTSSAMGFHAAGKNYTDKKKDKEIEL